MSVSKTLATAAFLTALIPSIAAAQDTTPEAGPMEATPCGAEHFQDLIGTHVSEVALPENAEVVRPNTIRTMIYLAERLNIGLDENDHVALVYCG
ncbi:I78 family peptidase inhibitor [Gymnodinialimonas hymeniacidonis]|uniref:I78 family peptidase inhibitor n=1 Tax=Gymnodinialimonas hymeniacidonis TaxID=3126508 RepID=UPI0034C66F31